MSLFFLILFLLGSQRNVPVFVKGATGSHHVIFGRISPTFTFMTDIGIDRSF